MNIRSLLSRFFEWVDGILPVWCVYCNRIVAKKNVEYEKTQMGAIVPLCPACHKLLFAPWSYEDEFTK